MTRAWASFPKITDPDRGDFTPRSIVRGRAHRGLANGFGSRGSRGPLADYTTLILREDIAI
jgi:hypothetical protein